MLNNEEWTNLHLATNEGHFGVVQILLDNNADVNSKS